MKGILLASLFALCSCASKPHYDYSSLKVDPSQKPICKAASNEKEAAEFMESMCDNKWDDSCNGKLLSMLEARFKAKYTGALPEAVKNTCARMPVECKKAETLEVVYAVNHNQVVDIFIKSNDEFGEDDLETEWIRFLYRAKNPQQQPQTVNHYHSEPTYRQPTYVQPAYLDPNYNPQKPAQYNTQCRTYSWGTDCNTTSR
jgi:hypothetical protein